MILNAIGGPCTQCGRPNIEHPGGRCPEQRSPNTMTTLAPHQQRVVDERAELSDRLSKLLCFFQTPIFAGLDAAERTRLRNQARFMDGYAAVLEERIAAFSEAPASKVVTDEMVGRFLSWRPPADFSPDGGILFNAPTRLADWPSGTNLLNAPQARQMLQQVLGG